MIVSVEKVGVVLRTEKGFHDEPSYTYNWLSLVLKYILPFCARSPVEEVACRAP